MRPIHNQVFGYWFKFYKPVIYLLGQFQMMRLSISLWPRILEEMAYTLSGINQTVLAQSFSPEANFIHENQKRSGKKEMLVHFCITLIINITVIYWWVKQREEERDSFVNSQHERVNHEPCKSMLLKATSQFSQYFI